MMGPHKSVSRQVSREDVPSKANIMNPLFNAIKELGGSVPILEMDEEVANVLKLSNEVLEILNSPEKNNQPTVFGHRTAWVRTNLKKYGVINNLKRGRWSITRKGAKTKKLNPTQVMKYIRELPQQKPISPKQSTPEDILDLDDLQTETPRWAKRILDILRAMHPSAFERLIQRSLYESPGFTQVRFELYPHYL